MNEICINQGNTISLDILLTDEKGDPISLNDGDYILFTVKNRFGKTFLQKTVTNLDATEDDAYNLSLTVDETINLPPTSYFYDCLYVSSEVVYTFISSLFIVEPAYGKTTDLG